MTDTTTEAPPQTITLTVPVANRPNESASTRVYYAIQYALRWNNPAGKHLSDQAIRDMTDAVMQALGIPTFGNGIPRDRLKVVDTDHQTHLAMVRHAVQELLDWAPEGGYPDEVATAGYSNDGVGFFASEDEYRDALNTANDGQPVPLLGYDPAYYAVAGSKGDGRSLKSKINAVREAVGIEEKQ